MARCDASHGPRRRALACCAAALLIAGCGRSESGSASASLVLYAAQGAEITGPLVEAFEERHPDLRVEIVRGGTGEMLGRIRAERASPRGDVLMGGALEAYASNPELFAPADVPGEEAFLARDPARLWHPFTTNVIHLVVNEERAPGLRIESLADLADPRFAERGRLGLSNPNASGTGYTVVAALVSVLGWDALPALLRNCWLTDSSDAMFKWVKDGEVAAGFLFEATLREYLAAGRPLRAVIPREGLITQTDGAGLLAGAAHPEAGLAFLAFLASEEAQEIARARIGRRPGRIGSKAPAGLLDLSGLKLLQPDPALVADRPGLLARYEIARAEAGK